MNNRRTGKIARLPKEWKDVVNLMLQDGGTYPGIIERLSAAGFKDINEQNLTAWFQGGHQDWLKEQGRVDDLKARREFALEYVKAGEGSKIPEAAMLVSASQILETLNEYDLSALMDNPSPKNYAMLVNALAKVGKGTLESDKFKANVAEQKRKIESEIGKAKTDGGISAETITKIEEALKLL